MRSAHSYPNCMASTPDKWAVDMCKSGGDAVSSSCHAPLTPLIVCKIWEAALYLWWSS